jgi:hypothetical protein
MDTASVERAMGEPGASVHATKGDEIEVAGYDDVEGGVEGDVLFAADVAGYGGDSYTGVEGADGRSGCLCALATVSPDAVFMLCL